MVLGKCLQRVILCLLTLFNFSLLSSENSSSDQSSMEESEEEASLEFLKAFIKKIKNEEQNNLRSKLIKKFVKELQFSPSELYLKLLQDETIFTDQKSSTLKLIPSFIGDDLSMYEDWVLLRYFYGNNGDNSVTSDAIDMVFDACSMRLNYEHSPTIENKEYFENEIKNLFFFDKLDSLNLRKVNLIYKMFICFFKDRFSLKFVDEKSVIFTEKDKEFFSLIKDPQGTNSNCLQMLEFIFNKNIDFHESHHQPTIIQWQTLKKGNLEQKRNSVPFRTLKASVEGQIVMNSDVIRYFSKAGFEYFLKSFELEFDPAVEDAFYSDAAYMMVRHYNVLGQDKSLSLAIPDWILIFGGIHLLPLSYAEHSYRNILNYFLRLSPPDYVSLISSMGFNDRLIFNPVSNLSLQDELIEIWLRSNSSTKAELLEIFPKAGIFIENISKDIKKLLSTKKRKKAKSSSRSVVKKSKEQTSSRKNCLPPEKNARPKTIQAAPAASLPKKAPKPSPSKKHKKRGKKKKKSADLSCNELELRQPVEMRSLEMESLGLDKEQPSVLEESLCEAKTLDLTSRREATIFLREQKRTKYSAESVKNHLAVNSGLVELYNTIKASTIALFHGPHVMHNLPLLHRWNQHAFRSTYISFLNRKNNEEEAAQIIEINRRAEQMNRELIQGALAEKSYLESMFK